VALEALRDELTVNQLAAKHHLHPNLVTTWKKRLVDNAASVFGSPHEAAETDEKQREQMLSKIGELTLERDFLARVLNR
jgi:transposase-like protein